jgi:hypothetical protein
MAGMSRSVIEDPPSFVREHGELHDTRIEQIDARLDERSVGLRLDDINANFRNPPHPDYPAYSQKRPAMLLLEQVRELALGLSPWESVRISSMAIDGTSGAYRMQVDLNLGGIINSSETRQVWILFGSLSIIEDCL